MHIPDGPLSPEICAATGAIATGAVGYSIHRLKDRLADKVIPLTGMTAALVFAGQMVNFPLVGTSGHLLGGVLCGVLLGPWAGCLAMTIVLLVQCLLFGDGGLFALGANIMHMGVVGVWGGYAVFAFLRGRPDAPPARVLTAAVAAAWLSVMAAAALFCVEFRLSYRSDEFNFRNVFTLMISLHSLIGVGEALITGIVVRFVQQHRSDLLYRPDAAASAVERAAGRAGAGLVAAFVIAAFAAPFASSLPDGLEAAAERAGFASLERPPAASVLDDYAVPGVPWQPVSVALAGIAGVAAVWFIAAALGRVLRNSEPNPPVPTPPTAAA